MRVFIVLAIRVYEPLYHALQIWRAYAWFFENFYCYLSLVFYILRAFSIKQLFHSCRLSMRRLKPTQRYAPCWLSIISYPTRSREIIDNYSLPNEWMMRDPNNNKMAGENLCSASVSETEILRIQEDTVPENTKKSSKFWILNFHFKWKWKLWLNNEIVLQTDFSFRLLIWTVLKDHLARDRKSVV